MAELKLPKLPDRTLVKLAISLPPDLKEKLDQYAAAYEAAYGKSESVADLIPYMLAGFLESDRAFSRAHQRSSQ